MAQFETLPSGSSAFARITQDAIDVLEGITAAEKAQAVPYCLIWQVSPKTGLPVNANPDGSPRAPLSLRLVEPPRFGSSVSVDARFRERPPVSLERVTVKTENPRGVINYRQVELSFMVHRPDVIFGDPGDEVDNWSSVLIPGVVHAMEYGWRASSGVRNGILNGEGYVNRQSKPPVVVPAVSRIRFTVTHYDFQILPDGQIAVSVHAFEDGEFNLRRTVPGLSAVLKREESERKSSQQHRVNKQVPLALDPYTDDGQRVMTELQQRVGIRLKDRVDGKGFVTFKDIADVLFADVIEDSYKELGYNSPDLLLGHFNERCGRTAAKYGGINLSGRPIGEFKMPLGDVEKRFGQLIKSGEQITFYNFINGFLMLFQDPRVWDTRLAKKGKDEVKDQTIPQVCIRPVVNKRDVAFYIFDIKREFTKFSPTDRFKRENLGAVTRDQVRKKLQEKGVPMVSFFRGNSYIANASFEAVSDDTIKTILMRRALRPNRQQIQDAGIKLKDNSLVDPRQLLYSSAISGELTMIGNFAFDLFSLIWLDFNVPRWDGPFVVMRREDTVTPGDFVSVMHVRSSGDDPLGTQGREDFEKLKAEGDARKANAATKPSDRPKRKGV